MNKSNKIIKVVSAGLVALASLTMVILAIINLIRDKGGVSETIAFRVIVCVMLIIAAVLSTCLVVAKDPHHFDSKLVIYNGLLLGAGIFVVLPEAGAFADVIVGWLIPCLIIGLGAFFIIATIISLVNKINKRNTDVFSMIIGVLMLVAGILLLCFAEKAYRVMWLVIGVLLLVTSIFALITVLKKEKAPKEKPVEAKIEEKPTEKTEDK